MDVTLENIIDILSEVEEDIDYENCTTLVDDRFIDSFDILSIISSLNDAFDISIPAHEIVPENFNSAQGLCEMVKRLIDEA